MVDNVTRWKLQEINLDSNNFQIFDSLYGNANIYHLADLVDNPKLNLEDAFVSGSYAYILMSNSKALEFNLLTKELTTINESKYLEKSRSKN